MGMPLASVTMLRLVPFLARSVGFGPVFFPSQGCLGHRSIHGKKTPVNALELVIAQKPMNPELLEDSRLHPLLKAPVSGGMIADARRVQCAPLSTRA